MTEPFLSTQRAAEIFRKMHQIRRVYARDDQFFKMSDVWSSLADQDGVVKIKTFRDLSKHPAELKAGVVEFDGRVTLVADKRVLELASKGEMFSNFKLAHELAHLGLDHHAKAAFVKNFQLYDAGSGLANVPPTQEELEANYGAVFFQCGMALLDESTDSIKIIRRAYSDVTYTKKACRICRLDIFREELDRLSLKRPRKIL